MARLPADYLTTPAQPWPRQDIHIGISGWTYRGWRGVFYPQGLAQRRELEFASRAFNSIEINGSFYSLQRPSSYQRWYDETPGGFIFSVKGGRFITWRKGRQPKTATLFAGSNAARGKRDVYVYFDNDAKVHAPFNARTLVGKLG